MLYVSVLVIIIAVLLIASAPYLFPNHPSNSNFPQVIRQKQLVISPAIVSLADSTQNADTYQWTTTVRNIGTTPIVYMNATLSLSGMAPVSTTKFMLGLSPVGSNDPIMYNMSATSQVIDLSSPSLGYFHVGQSFPETLTVTYNNGTSTILSFTAMITSALA
jgi:hypothetical protein